MNILEIPILPVANSLIQILIGVALVINIAISLSSVKIKKFIPFLRNQSIEIIEEKVCSFEESAYPKIVTDERGIVSSVNKEAEKLFGYNEIEWRGNNLDRIIPERFKQAHNEGIKRMIGKPLESKTFNLFAINNHGKEFPIELILRKKFYYGRAFYIAAMRDMIKEVEFKIQCEKEIDLIKFKLSIVDKGEEIGNHSSWVLNIKTGKVKASDGYKKITHADFELEFDLGDIINKIWEEDVEIINNAVYGATVEGKNYDIKYRMYRGDDVKVLYLHGRGIVTKDENGIPIFLQGSTSLLKVMTIREAENNPI